MEMALFRRNRCHISHCWQKRRRRGENQGQKLFPFLPVFPMSYFLRISVLGLVGTTTIACERRGCSRFSGDERALGGTGQHRSCFNAVLYPSEWIRRAKHPCLLPATFLSSPRLSGDVAAGPLRAEAMNATKSDLEPLQSNVQLVAHPVGCCPLWGLSACLL